MTITLMAGLHTPRDRETLNDLIDYCLQRQISLMIGDYGERVTVQMSGSDRALDELHTFLLTTRDSMDLEVRQDG